ncbi:Immunoglobulin-like domain [Trinorchestia longiramus]|nr:Immunoglobulin-like domain [Trinorchestia longiramus]
MARNSLHRKRTAFERYTVSWIRLRDLTVLSSGRTTFATDARITVLPGKKKRTKRSLESDISKTPDPVFDNTKETKPKKLCRVEYSEADKPGYVGCKLGAVVPDYILTGKKGEKFQFKPDCKLCLKRTKRNHYRNESIKRKQRWSGTSFGAESSTFEKKNYIFGRKIPRARKYSLDKSWSRNSRKEVFSHSSDKLFYQYDSNNGDDGFKFTKTTDYNDQYQRDEPSVKANSITVSLSSSTNIHRNDTVPRGSNALTSKAAVQRNFTQPRHSKVVLRPIEPVPGDSYATHKFDSNKARKQWLSAVSTSSLLPQNYLEGVWEPEDYTLQIKFTEPGDAGTYVCQINTEPKTAQTITLRVVDMVAKILGPTELFVKAGTPVTLACMVEHSAALPELSGAKKSKYSNEYIKYGFTVVERNGFHLPQCVICHTVLSNDALRPGRLERHLSTNHKALKEKPKELFTAKLHELNPMNLYSSSVFHQETWKLVKASYELSLLIAKAKKPHSVEETLVKPCLLSAANTVLGEESQRKLSKISLSDNTVKRRIDELSEDIKNKFWTK